MRWELDAVANDLAMASTGLAMMTPRTGLNSTAFKAQPALAQD
jgi:hypothetical protein